MSLHLIESRRIVSRTSRKRDGVLVSVAVHALLIVSTFTLATARPVVRLSRVVEDIAFVAPPPVESVRQPVAPIAPVSTSAHTAALPVAAVLTAPVEIPTIIPSIDIAQSVSPTNTFANRGHSSTSVGDVGVGTPGTGFGIGGSGILGEAQVDRPVSILSGYRTPRYPEALRAAGVQQTLRVEFVVDTLGRIETGSLTFRDSPHESFMNAVREALTNAKFRPAEVTGHRVRQRVTQAFVFSLSK